MSRHQRALDLIAEARPAALDDAPDRPVPSFPPVEAPAESRSRPAPAGTRRLLVTGLVPAVAAVVVGGTAITGGHGGIGRTVIGALIVIVLRVGLSLVGVDAGAESVIYGVLVIVAVALTIDRSKLAVLK